MMREDEQRKEDTGNDQPDPPGENKPDADIEMKSVAISAIVQNTVYYRNTLFIISLLNKDRNQKNNGYCVQDIKTDKYEKNKVK